MRKTLASRHNGSNYIPSPLLGQPWRATSQRTGLKQELCVCPVYSISHDAVYTLIRRPGTIALAAGTYASSSLVLILQAVVPGANLISSPTVRVGAWIGDSWSIVKTEKNA